MVVLRQQTIWGWLSERYLLWWKRPAGKDGNKKKKLPTAAAAEIGRYRHFKAPRRPHETSGKPSGKPSPVQSRQADTLIEKASEPVHPRVSPSRAEEIAFRTLRTTTYSEQNFNLCYGSVLLMLII